MAEWAKTYNHNSEYMCCFDVSSLFSDVPLNEAMQICLDNLKLLALTSTPKLPRSVLKDLLVFVGKRSHFVFDGQYCDQIDAGAMGFPFTTCCGQYFYLRFREKLSNE